MKEFFKILLVSVLFLNFTVLSHSEIIEKVEITGNERISSETIVVYGDIEKNKNYESGDINLIIKKLFDTRFFSDIEVELKNGILSIEVVENPTINLIIFKGIKAEKFKKGITDLLELREKTPFIKNIVTKDIDQIKGFYRHLGYYFVKIEVEVQELKKNRVNLVYSIDPGDKAKIAKIFFLGDKQVRTKRLLDIITSQESKFWKVLSKSVYLNEQRIELDKRLLENYYKNTGYYEVEVSSSNVEYIEGKGFVLSFSIDAGKRYRFGKVFANVSEKLEKSEFFSLDDEFKKITGEYYSRKKLVKILESIDEIVEAKELQFVNHRVTETLDNNNVVVKIDITEGTKAFIERVNIFGNNVTNESVIRAELLVDEGDPFSSLLVGKSINKLKAKNIFASVTHKVLPGSSADNKIIDIEIEEKPTGEIGAGAGVGTEGTSFSFFLTENNWLGRGVQVQGSLDVTQESLRGGINVTNPNYNYSGNSVSAGFSNSKIDKLDKSGYETTKTEASLGTSFEQYRDFYIAPSITASYEDVTTDASASSSLKRMDGTYTNLDFGYGLVLDKRNQPFQPTDGYRTKFFQRLPVFSDTPSIVNGIEYSRYHLLTEDIVTSIKLYGRTVHSLDSNEDVRISDRIYLPSRRLRGFQSGKLGPKDGDDFIGGNYAGAFSIEAALPNLLPEESKTDVRVFFDTANLWGIDYDSSLGDFSKLRASIGASADVYTPIGPLSLTLAYPLSKAEGDKTETFNFRLGTSF